MVPEALSIIKHCQPHMQQKPNTKLRDLLESKKAETPKQSELSKTEQNRLAKLNAMLDELGRGENAQTICILQNTHAQKKPTPLRAGFSWF